MELEQVIAFIEQRGLPAFVIAISTIAILGLFKLCKMFNKIQSKAIRKSVYLVIDIALAFAGTAIYYAIFKMNFDLGYVVYSLVQVSSTLSLYALFENMHIRELVNKLIHWVISWFKTNPNALKKTLKKLGVPEDTATKILSEADNAVKAAKAQAEAQAATKCTLK